MARRNPASSIALGGILAALAVVILCMGTLIPMATFLCPMLCVLILDLVRRQCGSRIVWAWFGAVALLGVLMAPDKEAAGVFAALGCYPIVKPKLDRRKLPWLWKAIFFNAAVLVLYWLLMNAFGMAQIAAEFKELGTLMTLVTLFLGNTAFFLLDRLLGMKTRRRKRA